MYWLKELFKRKWEQLYSKHICTNLLHKTNTNRFKRLEIYQYNYREVLDCI